MPSISSHSGCLPRWATSRTDRRTLGTAVAAVASEWGHDLMPWQRQVLDVALEVDGDGQLVYREVVVTVPRQSGKSSLLLPLGLHRCVAWGGPQRVIYAAQNRQAARSKFLEDWRPLINTSPLADLGRFLAGKGDEKLELRNGSYFELSATTETAGHGKTIDLAIIDEAFALTDNRLEQAFKPAMVTRPSAQMWVVSTAGTGDSTYLNGKVERGRAAVESGLTDGVAFFEWSAPDGADPVDPETWRACMPALGHTVDESTIRSNQLSMDEGEFARAFLNRWTTAKASPPIDPGAWSAATAADAVLAGRLVVGVDVAPDRRRASIVVSDGVTVELIRSGAIVDELAEAIIGVCERNRDIAAVWLDPAGPAGSLVPDLESAGLTVESVTARTMGQACAAFHDAVVGGRLSHRADARFDVAVGAAGKRRLGDLWLWNRSSTTADITPIVAATLAFHGGRVPSDVAAPVFAY